MKNKENNENSSFWNYIGFGLMIFLMGIGISSCDRIESGKPIVIIEKTSQ